MRVGVRIEESWSKFRPYRWLAERSVGRNRRKLIHRESFRASVLHLSEIQAVLESIAVKRCPLTTPSFLSRGTRERCGGLEREMQSHLNQARAAKRVLDEACTEWCCAVAECSRRW